jgi:hypothetical protein
MEWARGGSPAADLISHVEECAGCVQWLEGQRRLSAAMAELSGMPMPGAEQFQRRVMAEFDKTQPAKKPVWRWVMAGAMAASLIVGAMLNSRTTPTPTPPPPVAVTEPGFVPVPYTVPLTPQEPTTVWRMEIPVARLRAVGYRVEAADPAAIVEADVLVSQDGRARAIRPIAILNSN